MTGATRGTREPANTLEWDTLGRTLSRMRERMLADGFRPDAVVAIARGGLVAATYFANAFAVRDFHILSVRRNASDDTFSRKHEPALLWASPLTDLTGRSLLLVDDIVSEGKTMTFAMAILRDTGAAEVRTAAVAWFDGSRFKPDYCGFATRSWVVFPWEASTRGEIDAP